MQTPHDRFFRRVFSDPEHAAGELRTVLPAALVARLDCIRSATPVDGGLCAAPLCGCDGSLGGDR